jgi:drug/metabolite transporter (DMT)-like permease
MRRVATHAQRRVSALSAGVLLVLVLGSTLVVAKGALRHVGPLTLAALRYGLAALILLPLAVRQEARRWPWPPRVWLRLAAIGLGFYALGNGALFVGLQYVSAATAALLLGLVPLVVLLGGVIWLREAPTRVQLVGIGVALVGTLLFFAPGLAPGEPLGLAILAVGVLGNASLGVVGRPLARDRQVGPVTLAAAPLAIGGLVLLPIAVAREGAPQLALPEVATVLWLALVNTALAYVLYNHLLQALAAFEVSALTSLSPVVTAVGAWLVLNESLAILQVVGMVLTVGGVILIQAARPARSSGA